ncbi:hypothetical protein P7C71_g1570, partial [Lecanoromycetidae sp. Uapishka_2]
MEKWYHQNKILIPWALLGLEVAVSIGLRLYKIKTGAEQDSDVVPSPVKTLLPKLSDEEAANLPYPPDAYPGARDVHSPYGSLRVYEFGPEDGKKVLLVHGITNPCVAVGAIAHGLADKGCRVMLFDLPGRGYSSTPMPTPHSTRLFTTSILLALTSSPIPWTGNGRQFSLIGYSLGGGIVANFASYFPSFVSSLVLLAPAGLVRAEHFTLTNKFLYNTGLINEVTLEGIIKKKLSRGDLPTKATPPKVVEDASPVTEEVPNEKPEVMPIDIPELSRARPGITVSKVVVSISRLIALARVLTSAQAWQINYHLGFVKSFMSSIRHGPIAGQHADWRRIGERLSAQNATSEERYAREGLQNGKVLIIGGKKDVLIVQDELVEDATKVLGVDNVKMEFVDAGHELPVTKSLEIVEIVWNFWEQK